VHVHCKDVRKDILDRALATDMGFMPAVLQGIFTVPGDGCIPFLPLLQDLQAHNYNGWFVVEAEQDPRIAHPLTYAKLGYRNLLATAQAAGFVVTEAQQ
jgi:inosose dehydratase